MQTNAATILTANEPKARPCFKWAGGKSRIMPALRKHLPESFGTYYEPFFGGGAVFFDLEPTHAVIGDKNSRLIKAYAGIRDHVGDIIGLLKTSIHSRDYFETVRRFPIDQAPADEVAWWLLYLNKTAFNGLYRVNGNGRFNVPFGDYANPTICDEQNLRAVSAALHGVIMSAGDFATTVQAAEEGDLVYFDPPYVPASSTSSFTSYTADGFGLPDHRRLRDVARELKLRGVHVVISNSATPAVEELYRGFELHRIAAPRSIAARGRSRGQVDEFIIK